MDRKENTVYKKTCLVGLLVLVLFATVVFSQEGPPRQKPPSTEEHLKHLTEKLELTDNQIKHIGSILEASKKKKDELRNKEEEARKLHFEKLKMIHDEEDKKIEKLLSNEQKKKFVQLKKEIGKNRPPRGRRKQNQINNF